MRTPFACVLKWNMTSAPTYLRDPDKCCNVCRGKCGWTERHGKEVFYYLCHACGGSGLRSVKIERGEECQ